MNRIEVRTSRCRPHLTNQNQPSTTRAEHKPHRSKCVKHMPRKIPWGNGCPLTSGEPDITHLSKSQPVCITGFSISVIDIVRFRDEEKGCQSRQKHVVQGTLIPPGQFYIEKGPVKVVGLFNFPYKPKKKVRNGKKRKKNSKWQSGIFRSEGDVIVIVAP
jgi:hypothetical protein